MLDDWRLGADARIDESFGALHDWSHAGRLGNWVTVSGEGAWRREAARHERWRLRLINASNARNFALALEGLEGWLVALDGQPLASPETARTLVLATGQRADWIVDVVAGEGEESAVVSRGREGSYAVATFAVQGTTRGQRLDAPPALAPNPVPALGDTARARRARLRMEGGAMGGCAKRASTES